jgi:hypothetical protein
VQRNSGRRFRSLLHDELTSKAEAKKCLPLRFS